MVLRKNISRIKGEQALIDEIRYFFYFTTYSADTHTPTQIVELANDRCDQENIHGQLKSGLGALRAPVDDLHQQLGLHAHRRTRLVHQVLARDDDARERLASLHPHGVISSRRIQHLLMAGQYGGTKTQLSLPDVRDLRIPMISLGDQALIAKDIDDRLHDLVRQKERRVRQLALLAERRQALITAAVTGQIDVTTARGVEV